MREAMMYVILMLLIISTTQARDCRSNEECTDCNDLLQKFRNGELTRSQLVDDQCRSTKSSGFTCCKPAKEECKDGETCKNCPSLIKQFQNGEVTRSYVESKQCGESRGTFCCPEGNPPINSPEFPVRVANNDQNDENSPAYLPRVEDYKCGQFLDSSNIVGGEDAKPGRYPFTAVLGSRYYNSTQDKYIYTWRCGGTIINRWYILTAAHCYTSSNIRAISKEYVNVGDYDLSTEKDCLPGGRTCLEPNQIILVQEVKNNKDFRRSPRGGVDYDISLVKLTKKIETNKYVRFVCLPLGLPNELRRLNINNYEQDIIGVRAHAIGWGYTTTNFTLDSNEDSKSKTGSKFAKDIQQKVDLPILSNNECEKLFDNRLSFDDGKRMCAGGEQGKDSCKGDSGGPLVINKFVKSTKNLVPDQEESVWVQVGLTSFGSNKCGSGKPGVYTRITKYIDWIKQNLN